MIKGIPTSDLVRRVIDDAKSKKDYIVPANSVEVMDGERLTWGSDATKVYEEPMTPLASGQLMTYLGVPSRFVDRLRTDAPDLISINANRLLQTKKYTDKRMLRTMRGEVRAWLSDGFHRLDYIDVIKRILPMIDEAGYDITSANVTDNKLYVHVVSPRAEGEIRLNDPVRFGWIVSDSEVGLGKLSIQLFVDRLRCLNGMVIPEFSKKRAHIGGRVEASDDYLVAVSSETTKAADDALWFGIRDHIKEFSTTSGIKRVMDRLKEQTEAKVEGDPKAVCETLANKFLLNEEETMSVLYNFLEGGDRTKWGLANAVTALANTHDNYDRGVEYEKIGGDLLMLSGAEWGAIGKAEGK